MKKPSFKKMFVWLPLEPEF